MPTKSAVESKRHKILVIDDHAVFREGLVRILSQEKDLVVAAEAMDAPQALRLLETLRPDLIVVDIALEGMNGIDLTKTIRARYPDVRILTLSMHKEALYAERALRAGSNGYIMKRESGRKLLDAIRQILNGQTYISKELNELVLQKLSNPNRKLGSFTVDMLSDRELEVFQLIGQGYGTRQIADELNISMKTVEAHREHIRAKCTLGSNFDLVQQAIHWVHRERNID
jgi:DNA-binding NarL/FixJ family response regulator